MQMLDAPASSLQCGVAACAFLLRFFSGTCGTTCPIVQPLHYLVLYHQLTRYNNTQRYSSGYDMICE